MMKKSNPDVNFFRPVNPGALPGKVHLRKVWDRLGILFSSACVIHCLVVAFLPLAFPTIRIFMHATWIHVIVGIIILFTSPLAFVPGYKKHGLTWIIGLAISGLFFILLGVLLEGHVSDQASHGVSMLGSLILAFSHAKNLQHSQRHKHKCC